MLEPTDHPAAPATGRPVRPKAGDVRGPRRGVKPASILTRDGIQQVPAKVPLQQPTRHSEIARPIMAQLDTAGSTQETAVAFQGLEIGEGRPSITEVGLAGLVELLTVRARGDKVEVANELADRATGKAATKKAIVEAGAIPPLVMLVRDGAVRGHQENSGTWLARAAHPMLWMF